MPAADPVMDKLVSRLELLADSGATVAYGVLARELGLRMADLTAALEMLMDIDTERGQPLRAALCAARLSPDALPAPGFFIKAAALGLDITDPVAFVQSQRHRLRTAR